MLPIRRPSRSLSCAALAALSPFASAQVTFSIDHSGPTITVPSPLPITAGDILIAPVGYGPLAPPTILVPGGPGGLGLVTHPGCTGFPPTIGPGCPIEVDALSYGMDVLLRPIRYPAGTFVFSVDEFAMGALGAPFPANVTSELPGVFEGSADIYQDLGLPVGPLAPVAPPGLGNAAILDGNGLVSPSGFNYPGVGLIEPDFPAVIDGDDIDALDIDNLPAGRVFFSLDAAFIDPALGVPNSGTGPANGFPAAAVLVSVPGGAPVVYAAPALLGLDRFGAGTDDLDALALFENGAPGYQPSPGP
jgi:hypothetical protein